MSAARLSHGTSGWRRMVPVEEQGASSSTASNGSAVHSATSAQTSSAASDSRRDFRASRLQPRRRAIDRGDVGAGGGKLRGLAAGRGAQIGDAPSGDIAEQPRRQRRRGVLHPPRAFGKAGQRGHGAVRDGAHRAGRQHAAVEPRGPDFRHRSSPSGRAPARGHWRRRWRARSPRRRSLIQRAISQAACRARRDRARRAARRLRARPAATRH